MEKIIARADFEEEHQQLDFGHTNLTCLYEFQVDVLNRQLDIRA